MQKLGDKINVKVQIFFKVEFLKTTFNVEEY